jgi:Flp pilus assembly pilin Flp
LASRDELVVSPVNRGYSDSASAVSRFVRDDRGQDVVEYGLLAATVGLGVAVAMSLLLPIVGAGYAASIDGVGALWETPAPGVAP